MSAGFGSICGLAVFLSLASCKPVSQPSPQSQTRSISPDDVKGLTALTVSVSGEERGDIHCLPKDGNPHSIACDFLARASYFSCQADYDVQGGIFDHLGIKLLRYVRPFETQVIRQEEFTASMKLPWVSLAGEMSRICSIAVGEFGSEQPVEVESAKGAVWSALRQVEAEGLLVSFPNDSDLPPQTIRCGASVGSQEDTDFQVFCPLLRDQNRVGVKVGGVEMGCNFSLKVIAAAGRVEISAHVASGSFDPKGRVTGIHREGNNGPLPFPFPVSANIEPSALIGVLADLCGGHALERGKATR